MRMARREWLPRQAKDPMHGGWRRTGEVCHWPSNVKSTIKTMHLRSYPKQKWMTFRKVVATYNLEAIFVCIGQSPTRTILDHSKLSQGCNSCASVFHIEIRASNKPNKAQLTILAPYRCKIKSGTSAIVKMRVASKTSKTPNAWWAATNLRFMPLAIDCQIKNQRIFDLPQHTASGLPWKNLPLPHS